MVRYVFVGRKSKEIGKPLWEILGNLQDHGVGRLITRGIFKRYPEPSFYKIVKVEAQPPAELFYRSRKVIAWVEFTLRGNKQPLLTELFRETFRSDYQLIPKDEEEQWYKRAHEFKQPLKIIYPYIKMPPLLKGIYREEKIRKGEIVPDEPKIRMKLVQSPNSRYRACEEGEIPNHVIEEGYGTPLAPYLYENIEAARPLYVDVIAWAQPPPKKKILWPYD